MPKVLLGPLVITAAVVIGIFVYDLVSSTLNEKKRRQRVRADASGAVNKPKRQLERKVPPKTSAPPSVPMYQHRPFKILVLGNSGAGKTSLIHSNASTGNFGQNVSTVGVGLDIAKITIDGKDVLLQIWDTPGQEKLRSIITPSHYHSAQGILLVYDISDPDSLQGFDFWMDQITKYAKPNVKIIVVGTKLDLVAGESSREERDALMQSFDLENTLFFETSALESVNVKEVFVELARSIYANVDTL